jgi:N-methylhydantoinase B
MNESRLEAPRRPEHDLVTFEVLKHRLASIADEMMFILQRAGYSATTTQAFDFSVAICDGRGRLLTQGLAIAGHMGSIPAAVEATIKKFGDTVRPSDVYFLNDPYEGGMHLPDIFVIKPVYSGRKLIAYTCSVVHHADVGGRAPGSMAHDSTEIYQEGLRLPPLRLYREGRANQSIVDIVIKNVRTPDKLLGDIRAQVSACTTGERRLLELVTEYGLEEIMRSFELLMEYSERVTRSILSSWPRGVYEFTDYLDDDGLDASPIPMKVTLTVREDSIVVDYTGTSLQVRGAINCTPAWTRAWTYASIRAALAVDIPNNEGYFRPIEIIVPEGTILNMRHPGACAARGMTGHRLMDLMFGALAQIVPDRIPAASQGGTSTGRFGVYNQSGRASVFYDNVYGTRGASPRADGPNGVAELGANLSNVSIEVEETSFPLLVRHYALVSDSGGPGKFRGSLSIAREWEVLSPEMSITFRSDRRKFAPYGLSGGRPGRPSLSYLIRDGKRKVLPSKVNMRLRQGDRFGHEAPSGGGWGDPLERDPFAVLEDWRLEYVTAEHARKAYGVVIDEQMSAVDDEITVKLRRRMRRRVR